jgi:hypothetical protein
MRIESTVPGAENLIAQFRPIRQSNLAEDAACGSGRDARERQDSSGFSI